MVCLVIMHQENLKFYDNIDDKSDHCIMNISTDLKDYKDKKLQELYDYYEERKSKKKMNGKTK